MKMDTPENIMIKILSEEATKEEREQFFDDLKSDPEMKEKFETMRIDWEAATDAMLYRSLDEELAWSKQKSLLKELNRGEVSQRSISPSFIRWAAVLVVGLGIGLYLIQRPINGELEYSKVGTESRITETVNLADGSVVTLNQNSTVEYAMNDDQRVAILSGQAYFDISPDKERPFQIETENAYIKVLGTSFMVDANKSSTTVVVDEGTVELGIFNGDDKLILNQGFSGEVSHDLLAKREIIPSNETAWYTKELSFDQASLDDVLKDLEKAYYLNFNYENDSINNCHLTAEFNNENIEDVLKTLRLIFNIEFVKINSNNYTVRVIGCK